MATGETGFADVTFDLISARYHVLEAGHDGGRYVRDAEKASLSDVAGFFREVVEQVTQRALRCHELLGQPESTRARRRRPSYRTPTRSTTKTSVAPGLMTPPAPRSP